MAEVKYIKHLRDKEGRSIQSIAQTLGINWRTAKKYADCEDFNTPLAKARNRNRPVIGPYESLINAWLVEDQNLPRKQRHSAKRIYDRLVCEYGFSGGERTVREYVAHRKSQLGDRSETFVQLTHPVAHAQADFGSFSAFRDGCLTRLQYLVVSFPYSNAGFVQVLPGENSECLLSGLKWIFEHIQGVPRQIRFDNLTAAVSQVLTGNDRKLTEMFDRFALHYGFEPSFCNVARGNEKGHVENKVGYSRRNWFVPVPHIQEIESFNTKLFEQAAQDHLRVHYQKQTPIERLFRQEQQAFLPLPNVGFEVARLTTATVDKYGRFKLDGHYYHGSKASVGDRLRLKVSWNTITLLGKDNQTLGQYRRLYDSKETAVNWEVQLATLSQKPRAVCYSVYFDLLPAEIQHFLTEDDTRIIKQRLLLLSELVKDHDLETVAQAIEQAAGVGRNDAGAIRHYLYRLTTPERKLPLLETYTPVCLHGYTPDLAQYNQLTVRLTGGV